jgi:PAS domain S-box-containing protein
MQTVKRTWLLYLNWAFIALDVLFWVAYFILQNATFNETTVAFWGITPLILGITLAHLLYSLVIYPSLSQKNLWFSAILSFIFMGLLFSAVIETSGGHNYIYRAGYVLLVFFMGMSGVFAPITAVILTWLLYLLTAAAVLSPARQALWLYTLVNSIVTVSALLGWYVFHRFYLQTDTKEVAALASMLKQEQFKYSVILESITDGVIIVNTQGTVEALNQSAAALLGWDQEDAINLDYKSLLQPVEETNTPTQSAIDIALSSSHAAQQVSLLETHHTRRVYVDMIASPIQETTTDHLGETSQKLVGVIAVLRNVDEQKRQEQQRSDFISTASHEMRTPVASIQGFIELALNPKVATIDEKAKGYLEKAHQSTKHLGELFQDLLTVSKSDDGRLANNPQIIEVNELLREIIDQNKLSAEQKGLKVVYENQSSERSVSPLLYVNADPERLREVVLNLFENAVKYTKSGMITIGASLKDQGVILRVSDTGMGIANEDIPHLFQKFYRTDNSATREIGGTGLGLYISRQIIEMMGGKIWVESTIGTGSTFYVEIPRVDPATRTAAQTST